MMNICENFLQILDFRRKVKRYLNLITASDKYEILATYINSVIIKYNQVKE